MKYIFSFAATVLVAVILISSGCKKDKQTPSEYIIQVDSIHVTDTISVGENLEIEFFGTIGSNGCYSFNRFDAEFSNDSLLITVIGTFSGEDVCTDVVPLLNGAILQVSNLSAGNYIVAIKQPDDTELTEKIHVAAPPN